MDTTKTSQKKMTLEAYRSELKKCALESVLLFILGAGIAVGLIFIAVSYAPRNGFLYYLPVAVGFWCGLFGIAMYFRFLTLAYRLRFNSSDEFKLAGINQGAPTPRQTQKKWRKNAMIFAVIGLIIAAIIFFITSGSISCGGKPDDSWDICSKCSGVGKIRNEYNFIIKCPRCNGVGLVP